MKTFQTGTGQFLFDNKMLRPAFIISLGLAAIFTLIIIGGKITSVGAQVSQKAIKGEWTAESNRKNPNEIHLTFQRRSEKGGFSMSSADLPFSQLQGLQAEAISSARIDVNFSLVREAGTFIFEGIFSDGKGTGFWTLKPSEKFVSDMRSRGYDNLTEENLVSAATHDLTIKFIEDLKSAGYDNLTFDEIRRARTHDIDVAFINKTKAMGFEHPPMETLIRMSNHDITNEFVNEMKSAGFENLSIENLIRLKNHDVSAAFVSAIKAEGYSNVSPETAIRLKNHEIDANFIRRAKSQGYNNVTLEELIKLRNRDAIK